MNTENTNETNTTTRRSGLLFSKREKAYHVYMYTLQKRNYGICAKEFTRQHHLIYDTFRDWLRIYPEGKPYYDIDNPVEPDVPPKAESQMVKLSSDQLVPKKENEITDIRRDFSSSATPVMIKFYDCVISADSTNIALILSAIKNVSNVQGR